MAHPGIVALAGPNGAGKSTSGPELIRGLFKLRTYVDADAIAKRLSPNDPEAAALPAGREMLTKMRKMTDQRRSFAFETTLSGRSYATWISGLQSTGYQFHLVFLWLPYDDLAVQRVKDRVRKGGHSIPEDAIRRRYQLGLENFFQIYSPIAKSWRMYDNSTRKPRLVALGSGLTIMEVYDPNLWKEIYEKFKA